MLHSPRPGSPVHPDLLNRPEPQGAGCSSGAPTSPTTVDITATFDLKLQALRCHESQVGGHRFAAVEEWVRERARAAAAGEDFELGEMFHRAEIRW